MSTTALKNKLREKIEGLNEDYLLEHLIICTHSFVKKTQKTPKAQIDKAINYRTKYLKK